jgi:small-conductance mechanosensitive channel
VAALFHFRHSWFFVVFLFCGAIVFANLFHYVLFRVIGRKAATSHTPALGIREHLAHPARAIFLLTCVLIILPFVPGFPKHIEHLIAHATFMVIVAALGWFAVGCIYVLQNLLLRRYDIKAADNVRARRIYTQFHVFRRIAIGFVAIITAGALLWTFNDPRIWHYGSGLLASAGVATLVVAAAAKSTASNFLAGLQIALTEPIKLDDVVVVQGEWGRIEEITSSYVVVKIWDLRRLIVPLSWFIENAFANWTRESAEILTTSFLYLDYEVPVKDLRAELERIVKSTQLWNGKVVGLQVTNLTDRSMEVRCLMSADDSSKAFDLQCLVREEMMEWVREHYPTAFPTARFAGRPEAVANGPNDSGAAPPPQMVAAGK